MTPINPAITMVAANESAAAYMSSEDAHADRQRFVANLGWLLSQTREDIHGAYLDDNEMVHIVYKNHYADSNPCEVAYEELRNVHMDSYMAIIRDVTKGL